MECLTWGPPQLPTAQGWHPHLQHLLGPHLQPPTLLVHTNRTQEGLHIPATQAIPWGKRCPAGSLSLLHPKAAAGWPGRALQELLQWKSLGHEVHRNKCKSSQVSRADVWVQEACLSFPLGHCLRSREWQQEQQPRKVPPPPWATPGKGPTYCGFPKAVHVSSSGSPSLVRPCKG